ncbi:MAG TPA: hypothetical protein VJ936_09585 [Desulfobacteraceae bacterium]|nr:hypothetical protein [Desulfobacteraceae bacterium]
MIELPRVLPLKKDDVKSVAPVTRLPLTRRKTKGSGKKNRDRRRNRTDRRKSVRDGVFVSLSFTNERRKTADRRKTS